LAGNKLRGFSFNAFALYAYRDEFAALVPDPTPIRIQVAG
jgi:hypothetical protein